MTIHVLELDKLSIFYFITGFFFVFNGMIGLNNL